MKPAIEAAMKMVTALSEVQSITLSRADAVALALDTIINAEQEAFDKAVEAEKTRSAQVLTELTMRHHNRTEAYTKIKGAVIRLRGELEDGNADGAAIIAEALAPPADGGDGNG